MRCTVVVPCYNEEQRLPTEDFEAFMASSDVTFLFVDDGSSDGTHQLLESLTATGEHRSLRLTENSGKAEAVRRGVLEALEHTSPDCVGFWDADLATPLSTILEFRRTLEERPQTDLVLAARVLLCGRTIERSPWRHYIGRVFATVVSNMLAFPIYDTQCGAKLFRVIPNFKTLWNEPFLTRWLFDIELLARLQQEISEPLAQKLYEFPIQEWRERAATKLKPSDFLMAPWQLFQIARHYRLPMSIRRGGP